MNPADFAKTSIHITKTLDEALALAKKLNNGCDLRATLLPHGANTLPKLVGGQAACAKA